MIVAETFVVDIRELSIDECMNLLALKLDIELKNQIKDLIIIKKLIKIISERHPLSGYHLICGILDRIDRCCRQEFFYISTHESQNEELLKEFKEFQRIHSTKCYGRKEILFTIFYAERAIMKLYYND